MKIDDLVKTVTSIVALLTSLVAISVSWLNASNYYADRDARAKQEAFQNQIGISRIYFERLADNFCSKKQEALLLVQITEASALELEGDVVEKNRRALAGLAALMRVDFEKRRCPSDAKVAENAPEASGITTVQTRQADSTYAGKEQLALTAPATAANAPFSVFVQYRSNSKSAQALQQGLNESRRFLAPGVEQVDAVPSQNEIRIYKDTEEDRAAAQALQSTFLPDAKIVSLAKAYPNLRAKNMEVWLKD